MGREVVRKGLGRAPAGTRMPEDDGVETLGVEGRKPLHGVGGGWGGLCLRHLGGKCFCW